MSLKLNLSNSLGNKQKTHEDMPLQFCCSKHFSTEEVLGYACQSGPQASSGPVPGQAKLSHRNHTSERQCKDRFYALDVGCKQMSFKRHGLVSICTKKKKRLKTSVYSHSGNSSAIMGKNQTICM